MTWTKFGEGFADELLELSDAAFRLHVAATIYANRIGSDGRIAKRRLSLVPVPSRARRPRIVAELVSGGYWSDAGDAWELLDFFDDQLSAEEVACRRAYDVIRQRIRFAKTTEHRQELKAEEAVMVRALNDARERRRARASHVNHDVTHDAPLRSVSAPVRSAPKRERDREHGQPDAPLGGAPAEPNEEDVCYSCEGLIDRLKDHGAILTVNGKARHFHERCANRVKAISDRECVAYEFALEMIDIADGAA